MANKVKVLYFVDRMLRGGIQTFVMENIRFMDKKKIQIDFLLLDDGADYKLEDTLKELGCNVFKLKGIWIRKPIDYIKYYVALNKFFKNHSDYQVVHLHSTSKNFLVLKIAKKYGIKIRISHSHCCEFQSTSKFQIFIGNILKSTLKKYSNSFFACSDSAGKWLFGDENFTIIKNAVDLEKFKYDSNNSKKIREKLKLSDSIVIGHIGRFTHVKNHDFLIEVFKNIYNINKTYKLLLVGDGELKEKIKLKVNELGLSEAVIFVGFQEDVSEYLQAMDFFVLPSEHEGLGLVLIEAQAAGLKCFTSKNVVPSEAKVSNLLTFVPLKNNPKEWAEIILSTKNYCRCSPVDSIAKAGYDIRQTADFLQNFYIDNAKNN